MGFFVKDNGGNRWPNGVVPYLINPAVFPPGSPARQQVLLAINGWNTASVIQLQPSNGTEPQVAVFTNSPVATACQSPVGMKTGGTQQIACAPGAIAGVIMHEIGHCLGLVHEHQRPDRDQFVTYNPGNVQLGPGSFNPSGNFPKDLVDCPLGPYDCGSIMHYGATAFAKPGTQTLPPNNPAACQTGQRNFPSGEDIAAVRAMYDTVKELADPVALPDTSSTAPALAFHDGRLFLAWKGSGNDNLSVELSDDGGESFHGKAISGETSSSAPSLTSHSSGLLIAWRGSGNENLNVGTVELVTDTAGNDRVEGIVANAPLGDTSDAAPAICSHNGSVYLAFKGSGNDNLNVMVSTDNGVTFGNKHISGETSSDGPGMASYDGQLYIAWKGSGNQNLNVATVAIAGTQVTGLVNKQTFTDTSSLGPPALSAQGGLLMMSWKGAGNDNLNVLFPADDRTNTRKFISTETSSDAPALTTTATDQLVIAWKGSGNDNLNVATLGFAGGTGDALPLPPTVRPASRNLLQSDYGIQGNFELLAPADALIHQYFRDNDAPGFPWHFLRSFGYPVPPNELGPTPRGVSLIQSNFLGDGVHGNFEVIARVAPAVAIDPQRLDFWFFDSGTQHWAGPFPLSADGQPMSGVTGDPVLIQSTYGTQGNFELLVPSGAVIKQYFRDNDAPGLPWHFLRDFGYPVPPTELGPTPLGITFIQSNFLGDGLHGNFEVIARVQPALASDPARLDFWFLDSGTQHWAGPFPLSADGQPIDGVTGDPILLQSSYGGQGNFELLVPHGPVIRQYFRDNDAPGLPWHFLREFGYPVPPTELGPTPRAVTFIQSNFLGDGLHGNFEVIARVQPALAGDPARLDFWFLDSSTQRWAGPFPLSADGQPIAGITDALEPGPALPA